MKREIKFRAWNGLTMNYNIIVGKFGAFWINPGINDDGLDQNDSACINPFNTKCSDGTHIMQFTGQKDKNMVEIYEGDIVRILYTDWCSKSSDDKRTLEQYKRDISRIGTVVFLEDSFCIEFNEDCHGSIFEGRHGEKEVIGNIYQNQELLCTKQ